MIEKHVLLKKGSGHISLCILTTKKTIMKPTWHSQVFLIHGRTCVETVKLRQARRRKLCPELWCLAWFWIQNRCRNCAGKNRLEGFHLGQPVARGLLHACTYVPKKKEMALPPSLHAGPPIDTLCAVPHRRSDALQQWLRAYVGGRMDLTQPVGLSGVFTELESRDVFTHSTC